MQDFFDKHGLSPKQRKFLLSMVATPNPIVLYGGAGGGGKSYALRAGHVWFLMYLAANGFPKERTMLACSNYPLLRDRHLGKFDTEWGEYGRIVNSQTHGLSFKMADRFGGGSIALRNLDDPDKFRGTEASMIGIDEITEIPGTVKGEAALPLLLYPLRTSKGVPWLPFVAASNPDGVGHSWVKSCWITKDQTWGFDKKRFFYIPAVVKDNPALDYEAYVQTLSGLPDHLRRARLDGSWEAPSGARWPFLKWEEHTYDDSGPIPSHWRRFGSLDYGLSDPYCFLWHAVDEEGSIYTYREDYCRGLTAWEQVQRVVERTAPDEVLDGIYADSAMWARFPGHMGPTELSAIDVFVETFGKDARFGPLMPGYKQNKVHSLATLDKVLLRNNTYADWWIGRSCKNLWREMTGAVFDGKTGSECIDERIDDHAIDAARYGLHTFIFGAKPAPKEMTSELARQIYLAEIDKRARKTFEARGKRRYARI